MKSKSSSKGLLWFAEAAEPFDSLRSLRASPSTEFTLKPRRGEGLRARRARKTAIIVGVIALSLCLAQDSLAGLKSSGAHFQGVSFHYGSAFTSGGLTQEQNGGAWSNYGVRLHFAHDGNDKLGLLVGLANYDLHLSKKLTYARRESSTTMTPLQAGARIALPLGGPVSFYLGGGVTYCSIKQASQVTFDHLDASIVNESAKSGFGGFALASVEVLTPGGIALGLEGQGSRIKVNDMLNASAKAYEQTLDAIAVSANLSYYY